MTHPTREQLHQLAQEKSGELVQLVSELIQIPSENPTGSQRPVVDFVENYLKAAGIPYEMHEYEAPEGFLDGVSVAKALGQEPGSVFKTLVTVGQSREHYVCEIPVDKELDLKKAAKAVGEKSIAMLHSRELLPLTGYVHGGCSPIGMKKQFPTVFHETAEILDTIMVSAGKIGFQVELSPADLIELVGGTTADVTV